MTNIISPVTIGKLIEAYFENDNDKFLLYANFIADAYEQEGNNRGANIIRKRIDGSYKNDNKINATLDSCKPLHRNPINPIKITC